MNQKSSSNAWLILLPVVGIMAYASLQLWREYQPSSERELIDSNPREILGYMSAVDQNVKRKFADSLLWDPVKNGDTVFRNDSIRTGLNSSAKIGLIDKSELDLDENSLVVLEGSPSGLILDFKTGDFKTASKSSSLQIKLKDNLLTSKQSSLRVKTAVDKPAQIEVAEGKATLRDNKGKEVTLDKQNFAKIDEKGKIEAQSVQILLSSPEDKTEIKDPQQKISYPFTWVVLNPGITQEVFEISEDEKFENKQVKYAHQAIEASISRGDNYWRVGWYINDPVTKKRALKYSPIRQIRLREDSRLQLLFPENAASIIQSPGSTEIDFSWKSELPAKLFLFELSQNREFRNIVKTLQVGSTQLKLGDLEQGIYYWRITAFDEKNTKVGQSRSHKLVVETILPKSPKLVYPRNSFVWSVNEALRFEWEKHIGATEYLWIVSDQMDFKKIRASSKREDLSYVWNWQNPGEYYWKVRALDSKSQLIAESLIYRFVIEKSKSDADMILLTPKDQSTEVVENTEPMAPILFQWQPKKPIKTNYKIIISESPDFLKAITKETLQDTRIELSLPKEGRYFWKISWEDPSQIGKFMDSPPFTFNLQKNRNLPPVDLSYPESRAEIEIYREEELKFQWLAGNSSLSDFRIVIEKEVEDRQYKTIVDRRTKEANYSKSNLSPGTYRWYVRAIDSSGIQGMSSEIREFKILRDRGIAPPTINPPVIK